MSRQWIIVPHCLKKEAGLNDVQYRDALFKAAGIRSSKEIVSHEQYMNVIGYLEDLIPAKPEVEKKPIIKFNLGSITPRNPWQFDHNVSEEKWAAIGNLICKYNDAGYDVVACWPAYGSKYIKWRKRV